MLGSPAKMPTSITPTIPIGGMRRKASGRPIDRPNRRSFMSVFVSPRPVRRLLMLRFPSNANRLIMTYRVRKRGAETHFSPNSVLIIGFDRTITAIVAGTKSRAVYLTEDVKTFFSS